MMTYASFEFDAKRALELRLDARFSHINFTLSPSAPALSSCRNWNEQFEVMKTCKALKEYQIITQLYATCVSSYYYIYTIYTHTLYRR